MRCPCISSPGMTRRIMRTRRHLGWPCVRLGERPLAAGPLLDRARALSPAPPYVSEISLAGSRARAHAGRRARARRIAVHRLRLRRARVLPSTTRPRDAHVPLSSPCARRPVLSPRVAGHHQLTSTSLPSRSRPSIAGLELTGYTTQAHFLINAGHHRSDGAHTCRSCRSVSAARRDRRRSS